MIRDWKNKVALTAVGAGLLTLAFVGFWNVARPQSDSAAPGVVVMVSPIPASSSESVSEEQETVKCGFCDWLDTQIAIWDAELEIPLPRKGGSTLPRGELPCPPDTGCYDPNAAAAADSWDSGYKTAVRYCAGELTAPPRPPSEMPNLRTGFMAGLQDSCGEIPSIYSDGPKARCNDGHFSYSEVRNGTCSYHNGVAEWLR